MPRTARLIYPGHPHHITQRGVRRLELFQSDDDRLRYLKFLGEEVERYQLKILAYCLMTNHIHLVVVPPDPAALSLTIKNAHSRYARYYNAIYGYVGHLMQARFYSCPMDEAHAWAAVRYVERNPVEANVVRRCENYFWSSARTHCGLETSTLLDPNFPPKGVIKSWTEWVNTAEQPERIDVLKRAITTGRWAGHRELSHNSHNSG